MTTREKILLVPLCAMLLVVALSWRLWLIALGFAVAAAAVVWLRTEEGPIVRGIEPFLRHVRGAGVRACDRCHVQCPSRHVD